MAYKSCGSKQKRTKYLLPYRLWTYYDQRWPAPAPHSRGTLVLEAHTYGWDGSEDISMPCLSHQLHAYYGARKGSTTIFPFSAWPLMTSQLGYRAKSFKQHYYKCFATSNTRNSSGLEDRIKLHTIQWQSPCNQFTVIKEAYLYQGFPIRMVSLKHDI